MAIIIIIGAFFIDEKVGYADTNPRLFLFAVCPSIIRSDVCERTHREVAPSLSNPYVNRNAIIIDSKIKVED